MDVPVAEDRENPSDKLNAEYQDVLSEYLPFIAGMQEKSEGTPIEIKWKLMRESLVRPKKA